MPRTEEPTGGPLKILAIVLVILCVLLGLALFKQSSSAGAGLEAVLKSRDAFSNQVEVANTKMMEERGTTAFARSNIQHTLDRRASDALFFSNRVVQTLIRLQDAQREARTAQTDLQAKAATVATLEAQKDEATRNLEIVPRLQKELLETKLKLGQAMREHEELALSIDQLRLDNADMERVLDDPVQLRLQMKKAEDAAQVRRAAEAGRRIRITDSRMQLEWQPDGTVRPVAASTPPPEPRK